MKLHQVVQSGASRIVKSAKCVKHVYTKFKDIPQPTVSNLEKKPYYFVYV